MGKHNNLDLYPLDENLSSKDSLLGYDADSSSRNTANFELSKIKMFIGAWASPVSEESDLTLIPTNKVTNGEYRFVEEPSLALYQLDLDASSGVPYAPLGEVIGYWINKPFGGGGSGEGDMLKENYATRSSSIVDTAFAALGVDWSGVGNTPDFDSLYAFKVHGHTINDIENLQTLLNSKYSDDNSPEISDVVGLSTELASRFPTVDGAPSASETWSSQKINSEITNAGGGDMSTTTFVQGDPNNTNKVDRSLASDSVDYSNIGNLPTFFPVDPNSNQLDTRYYTIQQTDEGFVGQNAFENATWTVSQISDFYTNGLSPYALYNLITANSSLEAGKGYKVDASSGSVILTLPSNSNGSRVDILIDELNGNQVTLEPQSGTINGGASYLLNTQNSVYQAFYSSVKGEWFVLSDTGSGGIGDAPDSVPRNRISGAWIEDRFSSTRPLGTTVDQVWNETLNGGQGGWQDAAYTTDAVTSVNSKTGAVVLDTSNINDGLDKRYVTDSEKAQITTNKNDIVNRQTVSTPDPSEPIPYTVAYVTKAWFDANQGSLNPLTDYRFTTDSGLETLEDESGATYEITSSDWGKVKYSENGFDLPTGLVGSGGNFLTIINKSKVSSINLDFSAVGAGVLNQNTSPVVIPAGGQVVVRKINSGDVYLIS